MADSSINTTEIEPNSSAVFTLSKELEDGYTAKAFIWDADMKPLCNAAKINQVN